MTKKKKKTYIPGMEDVYRVFDILTQRYKKEVRDLYIRKLKREEGGESNARRDEDL